MPALTTSTFGRSFRGEVILPDDQRYDEARSVYNVRFDRRPAVVARCAGTADVVTAIRVAREHDLEIAVRGGGRHVAGYGTVDGGLVIDLGPIANVQVDPGTRIARLGAGARNRDGLIEAAVFGLAPVTGVVGHIGAAGLTLGGGIGFLGPRHGFASDNVTALQLVTAEGEVLDVREETDPELFWAVRGAGPNFGVVTAIDVRVHPVPTTVLGGDLVFAGDQAPAVLRLLRDLARSGSEDLYFFALYGLGADPRLPESLQGKLCLTVTLAQLGTPDEAQRELAELRAAAAADFVRPATYVDLHLDQEEVYPAIRQYWAAEHVPLSDAVIDVLQASAEQIRDHSIIDIYPWMGRMVGEHEGDGAFACRDTGWDVAALAQWEQPDADERQTAWAERLSTELRGRGLVETGVYPNMVSRLGRERLVEYYGRERYDRLARVKQRLDPQNLFRRNANVEPAS